jgi:hypothetical protein
MRNKYLKSYNLPRLDFWLGFGSGLDLGGTLAIRLDDLYYNCPSAHERDAQFLAQAWAAVGQDLKTAIDTFEQETDQTQPTRPETTS